MRVTFLLPRYGWQQSGGYAVIYKYASMLAERGHAVSVVHPRRLPPGGWPKPQGLLGISRRTLGRLRNRLSAPSLKWASLHPSVKILHVPEISGKYVPPADVVVATWWSTAEAMMSLPRECGARCYLVQGAELWFGEEDRVRATWRLPVTKITISTWLKDTCAANGAAPDSIAVVHNGIDTRVFRVLTDTSSRGNNICMHYSPDPHKGWEIGRDVLVRVKNQLPDLRAKVFGFAPPPRDLPPWAEYSRAVAPSELSRDIYNWASIYVCSSYTEGWHLPNTEAMASGCVVVTTDIDGVRDYAIDGKTARTFAAGNAAAAAAIVIELLTDEEQRARLVAGALQKAEELTWERSVEALEAVFRTARSGV